MNDEVWTLRIKSKSDLEISSSPDVSIQHIKQHILREMGQEPGIYIRLVCRGRLLAPDSSKVREFCQDQDVIHAILAPKGIKGGLQAQLQQGTRQRRANGVGVDEHGFAVLSQGNEESDSESVEEGRERLGFDRLRATGMRRSDIAVLRQYFQRHVDRWMEQNPQAAQTAAGSETDLVRRRMLQEDAWMQAQGPASEFRLNLTGRESIVWQSGGTTPTTPIVGTDRDFLWGFFLGYFVGFLMLIWVSLPTVPHKQKLGILAGICFQLVLNIMHADDQSSQDPFFE